MFALDISNTKRPPTHQSIRQRASTPLTRSLFVDIDRGKVTAQQVQEMTTQRQQLATPSSSQKRSHTPNARGNAPTSPSPAPRSSTPGHQSSRLDTSTSTILPSPVRQASPTLTSEEITAQLASFADLCDRAPQGVHPTWANAKQYAERSTAERSARSASRTQLVSEAKKSLGAEEAIEIARLVAKQEEMDRRDPKRRSVHHQVARFAALELKAREGLVTQEERAALFRPSETKSQEEIMESTVERHRARQSTDRAFRQIEPQHMMRMSSKKILKEDELASFGDELALLASKSDTARLVGNRNREARNALMGQLMSWAQGVLARGDLSDMLEEFIKRCTLTSDGSIRLGDIHAMMESSGLGLSAVDRDAFNDAVDPRGRGCVVPERLRQVWRSHEAVRRVKTMDLSEAEDIFDQVRLEIPGPITATFLSTWLKRTGAPVDADVCHTILQRLPRPVTKETLFSDNVFAFLQEVWLDARASEREVLTDAGMMDRAKQLEALSADTNETLEEVDRAARLMHTSSHRLVDMHEVLTETLEATAKLARRVPKTYTRSVGQNTEVSVTGEMVMLWEGFLVQRDLDLLDNDEDDKLTTILSKQNQSKADEIVRLRTVFESVSSKFHHKVALLSQKLEAEEMTTKNLRRMLEQVTVGPGGMLDFEQHEAVLEAQTREVNELTAQMNHRLTFLRGEHQTKVRELIHEVNLHKTRADESERRLLEELESTRQLEARWSTKIEALEEDVRGREEAVNSTNQVIAEYEAKYTLQEKAFEQLEAKLVDAQNESERLREQIHIYESETQGIMVPQAEVDRRLASMEAQLTQQISTEKASKDQFAKQLQAVKSDFQRLEFSSLDKCGALEQELQALRCDRDELEKNFNESTSKILQALDAVVQLAVQDRNAIAQCTDVLSVFDAWVASSHSTLEELSNVVDGIQGQLTDTNSDEGTSNQAEIEDIQRRIQQATQRTFTPPTNSVVEKLNALTAELATVSSAFATSERDRLSLADVVETSSSGVVRVLSQLEEYAAECIDAALSAGKLSAGCLSPVDAQSFVSTEELPESMGAAVHSVCAAWRRKLGDALDTIGQRFSTLETTVQTLKENEAKDNRRNSVSSEDTRTLQFARRFSAHNTNGSPVPDDSPVGRMDRAGSITVLVAPLTQAARETPAMTELLVEASEASDAVYAQLAEIRQLMQHQERYLLPVVLENTEQSLSRVTRDDLARLATQKRNVTAAQSSWRRHMWTYAIRQCILNARRELSNEERMQPIFERLASLWRLRWSVVGVAKVSQLVDAIGALTITVTTMMSTALQAAAAGDSPLSQKRSRGATTIMAAAAAAVAPTTSAPTPQEEPAAVVPSPPPAAPLTTSKSASKLSRAASTVAVSRKNSTSSGKQQQSSSAVSPPATPTSTHEAPLSPLGVPIAESLASNHSMRAVDRRRGSESVLRRSSVAASSSAMSLRAPQISEGGMRSHEEDEDDQFLESTSSRLEVVDEPIDADDGGDGGIIDVDDASLDASSPYGVSVRSDMFPRFEKVVRDQQRSPVDAADIIDPPARSMVRRRSSVAQLAPAVAQAEPASAQLTRRGTTVHNAPVMRSFGCQVSLLPIVAQPSAVVAATPGPAAPARTRPSSHTRETQTPPQPQDAIAPPPLLHLRPAAGTPPTESLVETPTGSQASESLPWLPTATTVDPQRRVDSAQRRRMVPRPQSSDRPRSAIKLDEESAGALRAVPTTPTSKVLHPLAEEPHAHSSSTADKPYLTWDDIKKRVQVLQGGASYYVDFPTTAQLLGGEQQKNELDLDNAIMYLFDSLPPHCRVAAGKYCLLAMFGCITEDVFVEYIFTHHYLPNRELFVAPRDDDLRRSFLHLRRTGGLLMKLRLPIDDKRALSPYPLRHHATGGGGKPTSGSMPAKDHHAAARVDRAFEQPMKVPDVDHTQHKSILAGGRPFSANSFPAAVVVLPVEESNASQQQQHPVASDDMSGGGGLDRRPVSVQGLPPGRMITAPAAVREQFHVIGASFPSSSAGGGNASRRPDEDEVPSGGGGGGQGPKLPLPIVAVRVDEHRVPSASLRGGLPTDRSDIANGTVGATDALVVMSRVEQTTADLMSCGAELRDLHTTLASSGGDGVVAPLPLSNSFTNIMGGRTPTPSSSSRPTVMMEFNASDAIPRRGASAISEAARQKALARPTKKLPILGRRDVASAEVASGAREVLHLQVRPSSTTAHASQVMNQQLTEYIVNSSQSAARSGPPLSAARLAPLPRQSTTPSVGQSRPPTTNLKASSTIVPTSTEDAVDTQVVVELPSVTRRK